MKMAGKLKVTTPNEREIEMTREFNAPPHLVFKAWTTPELLKRWLFGPDGWSLETCDIDLRVGGKYRFVWRGPDGELMGMSGEYREIVPGEKLVTTELFDEDWTGGETLVTLTFIEHDGKTRSVMRILYASKDARDGALKTGMADGMEMGYVRLETWLANEQAAS